MGNCKVIINFNFKYSIMHKVLIIGCGNMGKAHARAYHQFENSEIVGLVSRGESKNFLNDEFGGKYNLFSSLEDALAITKPDVACISTYTETHVDYSIKCMEAGAHVFLEKPVAASVADAKKLITTAERLNKKLVVGYILRVHPAWQDFIKRSREMGSPFVMRMNLNQQSSGDKWMVHKNLMKSTSPIVDCGVHYVDIMCQITDSKPLYVSAVGTRLTDEIDPNMYNFGHLQVAFEDGSIGWYESGWGPMISETAFFVKDVVGVKGCVSMIEKQGGSDDIESHTNAQLLKVHHSETDSNGKFVKEDELIEQKNEPDHDTLCKYEQEYLIRCIDEDADLSAHWKAAVDSLAIVLAADESIHTKKTVRLN